MTAEEIVAAARSELGTPFAHQGRIPGKRLDCAGLLIRVAFLLGVPVVDHGGYARRPSNGLLESALDNQPGIEQCPVSQTPGLMFLMRFKGEPQHLGICTGDTLIHAYEPTGKVCEHRIDDAWRRRIVRAYRFKEMNHG